MANRTTVVLGNGPGGTLCNRTAYIAAIVSRVASLAISGPRKKGQIGLLLTRGIENRNTGKIKNVRLELYQYALDFSRVCPAAAVDTHKS